MTNFGITWEERSEKGQGRKKRADYCGGGGGKELKLHWREFHAKTSWREREREEAN